MCRLEGGAREDRRPRDIGVQWSASTGIRPAKNSLTPYFADIHRHTHSSNCSCSPTSSNSRSQDTKYSSSTNGVAAQSLWLPVSGFHCIAVFSTGNHCRKSRGFTGRTRVCENKPHECPAASNWNVRFSLLKLSLSAGISTACRARKGDGIPGQKNA